MDVERRWLSGTRVYWETGFPSGRPVPPLEKDTHCSAFAAAAAERLGIYLLRPPEHSQLFLANAQYDWLAAKGARHGWIALANAVEAQNRANQGDLVVVVHRNPDPHRHGHIAIVRPDPKSIADVEREGPQITEAGDTNYRSTTVSVGFPRAWAQHDVRFYAHAVPQRR